MKLKQKVNSIRFRTWLMFFVMAIFIVIFLWLCQVLLYSVFYKSMKQRAITAVGRDLTTNYRDLPSYWNTLTQPAQQNNVTIYLFRLRENPADISDAYSIKKATPIAGFETLQQDTLDWSAAQFEEYLAYFNDGRLPFHYFGDQQNYMVYGNRIDTPAGYSVYLYVSSYLDPIDSTVTILSTQLVIVTLLCLVTSLILGYVISKQITKPIVRFAEQARKLGHGDYSIRFEETGYDELNDLAFALNRATEEMGKTEEFRREFIANVSHDLRTPLTMVKAYAEMIRDISGRNEEKRTQHAQVIIDEAERLNNLVNDIQNLSKLQAGTDTVVKEDFNLAELCNRVINQFGVMNEKFGYILERDIATGIEVNGDAKKVEQVLYNLLGNAINYTGEDKKVKLTLTADGGGAKVMVSDTGKGIAAEEIDSVWDRYYRANQRKRNVIGSGLGLSIVKSILVAHGAEYGIDSELGKGTTFWFKLPLKDRQPDNL